MQILRRDDSSLPPGDVIIDVEYSDLNFKDALTMAPGSTWPQFRPIVPGIDLAGVVRVSRHARWVAGDRVVVTGFGLGTERDGGLSQRSCVPGEWIVMLP